MQRGHRKNILPEFAMNPGMGNQRRLWRTWANLAWQAAGQFCSDQRVPVEPFSVVSAQ